MEYLSSAQRVERLQSPVSAFLPRDEDIVDLLRNHDFDTRLQTLNRMILLCKKDIEWFTKFSKKGDLMKNLDRILAEDRWEVQHQAIRFLLEAMPSFGNNLEYCMAYIMPNLLPKLGSSKITIKRVTVQVIQNFTRLQPQALHPMLVVLNRMIQKSTDRLVNQEVVNEIPTLFQDWLRDGNWGTMVEGFMSWMTTADEETKRKIAMCLRKLQAFIGSTNFDRFIVLLAPDQRELFTKEVESITLPTADISAPSTASTPVSSTSSRSAKSGREMRMRFGIVPTYLATMLADEDHNTRSTALEKLKQIIETMSPESTAKLIPHLHSFFVTLGNVLNDLNFKVIIQALDLVRLTVNRLKANVEAHLQQVIALLSRHLGNQKAVVKQIVMMTVMDLFRSLNPKAVVAVICPFLEHKNSRVREEVLNIITASLLIVPPSKMNLSALANLLVPRLVDPKRRVRLAAFEQLSVLAFHLNGKLDPILKLVKEYEQKCFEGLTAAVKARLLRGTRPTIRYDGLLEYSTPPISDSSFDVADEALSKPENLDLHWILHINGAERTSSPPTLFSSYKTVVKGEIAQQVLAQQKALWESESEKDDASLSSVAMMERQKSDDQIARRPTREGALQHPANSSNSWSSPLQKFSSPTTSSTPEANNNKPDFTIAPELNASLDRLRFLAIQKRTAAQIEAKPIPSQANGQANGRRSDEKPKKAPLAGRNKSDLSRARSETTLSDDRKENVPLSTTSHDDTPIRGMKNGTYDADQPSPMGPMSAKSASHHSLPITTSHASLRQQNSNPSKKAPFLRAGSNNRSRPQSFHKKGPPVLAPRQATQAILSSEKVSGPMSVPTALKKMENEDWNEKVEGINMISELSEKNPQTIVDNLNDVTTALLNECKNLRSSVSRVAIACLGQLHVNLKGKMDPMLEKTTAVLITRSGDVSNAFIRDDATEAVENVVKYGSPNRVLASMITAGAKSKNNTVRCATSVLVSQLLNRIGTTTALQNGDFLQKLIPLLLNFAKDQTPKVRQHAKLSLCALSQDSSFDRQMRKHCSDGELATVRQIVGDVDKKGGVDALDSSSASIFSRNGSVRKSVNRKLPDNLQLDLDEIREDLNASGWERRLSGLRRFEEMTTTSARAIATNTTLVEAFIARLSDINSKVSLAAMETYIKTLPSMARFYSSEPSLKAVLNQLLLSLSSHLPSRSEEHRHLAQTSLQETLKQIDSAALSSHFAAVTKKANVKQRPFLLHLFTKLNADLHKSKPKQVEVVALPILWECLKSPACDADNKRALSEYSRGLQHLLGARALGDAATSQLDPHKKKALDAMLAGDARLP